MTPMARLTLSVALLSAWLILLLSGFAFGGAVHLLLVGSLVSFPWREARKHDE
jgi:hypothetical protein